MKRAMQRTLTRTLLGTSLALVLATPAFADDSADSADSGKDIIVTARRVEERLQDVPISITVFRQEEISNRNIVSAGDLATFTPSLSTNSRFGNEKTSFSIRGFVQESATGPSVGVYFAEASAPRATGITGGGNGAGPGALFDLQNVQVLKGPQGTLFGRNTTGGAILLVPVKPKDSLGGYVEGSLGNFDMKRVQAVLNVPLADSFRVRLGVDRQTRDGYVRNLNPNGAPRFGDVDYWAARASIVADLTPDLENYTVFTYSKSDTVGSQAIVVACNRTLALTTAITNAACNQVDQRAALGNYFVSRSDLPDQHQTMETWQVINTTTWTASDSLTVKNIVAYGEYKENFSLNSFGFDFGSYFYIRPLPGLNMIDQSTLTEELQFQGVTPDGKLTWQVGGFLEHSNPLGVSAQRTQQAAGVCTDVIALQCNRGVVLNDPPARTWFRNYGLYAQATYKITDQLSFTGGLRYTWEKSYGDSQQVRVLFPVANNVPAFTCVNVVGTPTSFSDYGKCTETATARSSKPTWIASLEYKPVEDVLLYAKYSRGYRAGGIDLRQPSRAATWLPEKVDTYELGAKASFDGAVSGSINVAAFYNNFTNQQLQLSLAYSDGRRASAIVSAGRSVIKGLEVDASLTPVKGLRFDIGYAYLDTLLKSYTRPDFIVAGVANGTITTVANEPTTGRDLLLSPHHKVVLTGTYTLPLDESLGEMSLSATFVHTSGQYASYGDTPFAATIGFDPGYLPATNLLNLSLNWNSVAGLPLDLSVFGSNVTDKHYALNTGALYAQPGIGFSTQIVAPPRMYGARVRFRFGS